jgi:demethylmenaquinone methyltransferase/2-methoxy-6-polyprenyl-1,4-benzoquinol methylase
MGQRKKGTPLATFSAVLFEAYHYLPASLKTFPSASELKKIMEACGWSDVHFHHLYGGMVAIHSGVKKTV